MGKIIKAGVEHYFGGTSLSGGSEVEVLTQAEYDALPDSKYTDDKIYMISDSGNAEIGGGSADGITYDNTESGLEATNVQGAVDEIDEKVDTIQSTVDGINTDVSELSQNINTHYNVNTNAFVNYTLATAIGQLLASFPEKGTYSGRFKTSEGWYTIHCFYAGDAGKHSGYVSDIADATKAYIFSGSAGADAVLKKLGSGGTATITLNLSGSASKSYSDSVARAYLSGSIVLNIDMENKTISVTTKPTLKTELTYKSGSSSQNVSSATSTPTVTPTLTVT